MFVRLVLLLLFCKLSLQRQPNVLFVVVDDLRPNLGVYGVENAFTPNIDRLAKKSIVFNKVYAQQALCAPSRNSFLTSRRPDSLHLYDFYSYWRDAAGNYTTMPQHFKEHGYHTYSVGKVFHQGISSDFNDDARYSWSEPPFHPATEIYKESAVCPTAQGTLAKNLLCPVIVHEQPGGTLPDLETQRAALDFLKSRNNSVNSNQPYFLAVGYHKPHVPLKYPIQYLQLHPLNNITLPLNRQRPALLPTVAWNPWNDVRHRDDIASLNLSFPFGTMPDTWSRKIIQSYNAAISYIDDLIGELIQNVDSNTIIVLTGDHGWSLSEHGEFSKFGNFETAVRVPLIIHVPQLIKENVSPIMTDNLVELVDLFPTLVDLTSISESLERCACNSSKTLLCTEGRSLVPLIVDSVQGKKHVGKDAVFYQYPRPGLFPTKLPNSDTPRLNHIKIMGYTIRTHQHRYTEWVSFNNRKFLPNWSQVFDRELYDLNLDPNENINLVSRNELSQVVKELSLKLKLGWRYVL